MIVVALRMLLRERLRFAFTAIDLSHKQSRLPFLIS